MRRVRERGREIDKARDFRPCLAKMALFFDGVLVEPSLAAVETAVESSVLRCLSCSVESILFLFG